MNNPMSFRTYKQICLNPIYKKFVEIDIVTDIETVFVGDFEMYVFSVRHSSAKYVMYRFNRNMPNEIRVGDTVKFTFYHDNYLTKTALSCKNLSR